MEENNLILTLTDENDEEFVAELIDSIMYDGRIYSLFVPESEKDSEEQEVIIMEYKEENGDVTFLPVDNEVLLDEIWTFDLSFISVWHY